ncbi:hypothetical protein WICPIJ_000580 [Wickerhamomyces pijperi]|uniref:Transcription regulator Rua1 C-terminal domain-containing protein n=1 Tax=Wickerhamomyces pijperi TaxID=599730 RepID=A0A9P8TRK7_WICPI|nr:hypothetical protein WICPIJ_000580 [Wickerhamomyces pijperi]
MNNLNNSNFGLFSDAPVKASPQVNIFANSGIFHAYRSPANILGSHSSPISEEELLQFLIDSTQEPQLKISIPQTKRNITQNYTHFISRCKTIRICSETLRRFKEIGPDDEELPDFDESDTDMTLTMLMSSLSMDSETTRVDNIMRNKDSNAFHGAKIYYTAKDKISDNVQVFVICPYCQPNLSNSDICSSFYCIDECDNKSEWANHLYLKHGMTNTLRIKQPIVGVSRKKQSSPSNKNAGLKYSCLCPHYDKANDRPCLQMLDYDSNLTDYLKHCYDFHVSKLSDLQLSLPNKDGSSDCEMVDVSGSSGMDLQRRIVGLFSFVPFDLSLLEQLESRHNFSEHLKPLGLTLTIEPLRPLTGILTNVVDPMQKLNINKGRGNMRYLRACQDRNKLRNKKPSRISKESKADMDSVLSGALMSQLCLDDRKKKSRKAIMGKGFGRFMKERHN